MANMEQMQQHMQRMLQRVEAMEGAPNQANTVAAEASQRALDAEARAQAAQSAAAAAQPNGNGPTSRFNSLVDTRLLSEPRNFDGTMGEWKHFKFLFAAYAGAVSSDLRKIMHDATAAATDAECLNVHMDESERNMSTQLYYMLVLQTESTALRLLEHAGDCEGAYGWRRLVRGYEPDTAGRHVSLLLEILSFEFSEDIRGSLDSLDLLIMKYEDATKNTITEPMKADLVRRGIKDTSLREHLVTHSARLSDYVKVKEEVRNIMVTRGAINDTLSPMDISSLGQGQGQGQGNGHQGLRGSGLNPLPKDGPCEGRLQETHQGQEEVWRDRPARALHRGRLAASTWRPGRRHRSDPRARPGLGRGLRRGLLRLARVGRRRARASHCLGGQQRLGIGMPALHAPEFTTREVVKKTNFRANGAKVDHVGEKAVDYAMDDSDTSLSIDYQVAYDKKPILAEISLVSKGSRSGVLPEWLEDRERWP